jgi:hypothetical protein
MINIQPPAHERSVHAAALREAAERRARAQRDLVVASLLRCSDRSEPSRSHCRPQTVDNSRCTSTAQPDAGRGHARSLVGRAPDDHAQGMTTIHPIGRRLST